MKFKYMKITGLFTDKKKPLYKKILWISWSKKTPKLLCILVLSLVFINIDFRKQGAE